MMEKTSMASWTVFTISLTILHHPKENQLHISSESSTKGQNGMWKSKKLMEKSKLIKSSISLTMKESKMAKASLFPLKILLKGMVAI
jgi:hypothetical protein